jgi:hypothetical protein
MATAVAASVADSAATVTTAAATDTATGTAAASAIIHTVESSAAEAVADRQKRQNSRRRVTLSTAAHRHTRAGLQVGAATCYAALTAECFRAAALGEPDVRAQWQQQ